MSTSRIPLNQVFRSNQRNSIDGLKGILRTNSNLDSNTTANVSSKRRSVNMATPVGGPRGTRTPQMLEYERQAEERAREQERMAEEKERMYNDELDMQREIDRIAQESYEMKQYYEAEQLKHAEEMRIHQEDVRRHQERVREHQRRLADHEASSEAFAKVIAMPAKQTAARQVSFLGMTDRGRNGGARNGDSNGA